MARPYRARRWRHTLPDPAGCWLLARTLNISPVTAQVLYNRGLTTPEAAHAFLTAGREQILDPFRLKDMDRAVAVIRQRIARGGPIMVYGDYDVDGVTGTTILVLALRALGAQVDFYIPNRFSEGYGLNVGALEEIHARGYDFVISVDTGVTAVKEAEAAKAMGMTLVVSDHHEPGPELPDVPALINPKRPDCTYPFKGLSGVGVAFKLALALEVPGAWDLIDIVTLGTIADMVPLVGENRAIVREGLAALGNTRRPGLRALMEVAGVKPPVTATHIGYSLGPRLNALGRMGSAMLGVELLCTEDPDRATALARHLDEENKSRQEVEAGILEEALQQAERLPPGEKEFVMVLAGEGWHHGVVGICASRVLESYHRPSILLSIEGDEARGSARSIPAFHMHRALLQVSDLFTKFGGHAAAAGMTLKSKDDIAVLRRRLNDIGRTWLKPEDLVPELRIDATVTLEQVNHDLLMELQRLEPYGIGNPQPIFAVSDVTVADSRTIGKEATHLKLLLRGKGPGALMDAVGWSLAPAKPATTSRVQVAFHPEYDTYQGRNQLRLTMRDVQVITSPDGSGMPVNLAQVPQVTEAACQAWDPLLPLRSPGKPASLFDARDHRLPEVLMALNTPAALEVAATNEATNDESEHERPEPSRRLYLEGLLRVGARTLVYTASPWSAAALTAELRESLPDLRTEIGLWLPGQPEPATTIVVAAYGMSPEGAFADTVLYHPPYSDAQMPGGRVHLLWERSDWALAEAALGWPYPDRDVLVTTFKQLKAGAAGAEALAKSLSEPAGPWNQLRYEAALAVFRELGLVAPSGGLLPTNGAKFQLESSPRYRRGMACRATLREFQARDWPDGTEAL
ncbi:MAG TPA: single-stranded-DNA-specific exonuclease RecJ [Symbiobacteriaceae bacterium]|nr:single-stranded-DNA-specific exonuclease RecJ [Symbiobacteriaceae bacterium]